MWLPYGRHRSFWREVPNTRVSYRTCWGTIHAHESGLNYTMLYSMQVNVLLGSPNPKGVQLMKWTPPKVNPQRYKSIPWNNNILTVACPVCRLSITDYRLHTAYSRLPTTYTRLPLSFRLSSSSLARFKTRFTFFLLFAHKNSYIYTLTSFPEKYNKKESESA